MTKKNDQEIYWGYKDDPIKPEKEEIVVAIVFTIIILYTLNYPIAFYLSIVSGVLTFLVGKMIRRAKKGRFK